MGRTLFIAGAWVIASTALAEPFPSGGGPGDEVFGLDRLHRLELTVAADDYRRMDPPPTVGFFAGPQGVSREHAGAGNMNYEFEYVPAEVRIGGETFANVGLRYKGSGTYMMSQFRAKRSLKIDFDRNDERQRFRGLAKLNLNSGVMDSSRVREALAYEVFRAAGVPAPRTAFAEVVLTVPGRFDREYLGLYTVVEQVDERFLEAHFGDGEGLLLKPEGIRGLPYLGADPAEYATAYNVKSKVGRGDWSRLVELARLVNEADEEEFREKIGEVLDVEGFARFLAANAMLASLDGFIGLGHNFYLYLSPETGKFSFIPWDLDLAFGAFAFYGNGEQLADLSIAHPHLGENKLIDRLLEMPEFKAAYLGHLRQLVEETFVAEELGAKLAAAAALAEEPIAREEAATRKRGESTTVMMMGGLIASMPLEEFIARRAESVREQLAGEREGYVPRMSRFGGGPPDGR